jgi:hypothetical protein
MSRRKNFSNPSQFFSNVFTWSSGLVVLCLSFSRGEGRLNLGFWSFQRTSQKREHGFGCGIGVMRYRGRVRKWVFNLSSEIGTVSTFSLGRCHVPSQCFSNVFTWPSMERLFIIFHITTSRKKCGRTSMLRLVLT